MALLKVMAAAERLGVSESTLRRWLKDKRLPARKFGKQFFIREEDIRRIEDEGLDLEEHGVQSSERKGEHA